MPRKLVFEFNQYSFECSINKVDRSKLYGSVSIETLDKAGERCKLASLAIDGKTLIPNGGTALGYLNPDGHWLPRKTMTAVDLDGEPLPEIASSFDAPIPLQETVSVDTYLEHEIRLCYLLKTEQGSVLHESFVSAIEAGEIFRFPFSYRGGVDADPAFVMQGDDNDLWLLIGDCAQIDAVGLQQAAVCLASQELVDDDEDDIDFHML